MFRNSGKSVEIPQKFPENVEKVDHSNVPSGNLHQATSRGTDKIVELTRQWDDFIAGTVNPLNAPNWVGNAFHASSLWVRDGPSF